MTSRIHMMTAALAPGDAIGNYIQSLLPLLQSLGYAVELYADFADDRYPLGYRHSATYRPTGDDLLWLHYSIYSDNIRWLRESSDFKIIDSHNVCPAYLFHGYDAKMEDLCARGEAALATFAPYVDLTIVHTEYVRDDMARRGFRHIRHLPLVIDAGRFTGKGAPDWDVLLSRLDYLLFVGRVVPQKNLKQAIRTFAALRRRRPSLKFFLVGGKHLPEYARELEALCAELGVQDAVVFVGPVAEPDVLTSFYRHARFYFCISAWESFCVPIIEALHHGTPVLGHAVPPIPETMGPGGIVLDGDAEAMAAQIHALWDDNARYKRLQHDGRNHVGNFTDGALRVALRRMLDTLPRRTY
jgi:glycosyltransferase involved in cell wall biosynthesis